MTDGILNRTLWKPLLVWIFSNCTLVLVPAILVVFVAVIITFLKHNFLRLTFEFIFYSLVLEVVVLHKLNAI